jgi:hypothetical protein
VRLAAEKPSKAVVFWFARPKATESPSRGRRRRSREAEGDGVDVFGGEGGMAGVVVAGIVKNASGG